MITRKGVVSSRDERAHLIKMRSSNDPWNFPATSLCGLELASNVLWSEYEVCAECCRIRMLSSRPKVALPHPTCEECCGAGVLIDVFLGQRTSRPCPYCADKKWIKFKPHDYPER